MKARKLANAQLRLAVVARQLHLFLGLTDAAFFLLFSLFIQVQ